jgi:hypothetical protein
MKLHNITYSKECCKKSNKFNLLGDMVFIRTHDEPTVTVTLLYDMAGCTLFRHF